jgi:hypothetical protein
MILLTFGSKCNDRAPEGRVAAARQWPYFVVVVALVDSVVAEVLCVVVGFLDFFLFFFDVDWVLDDVFFMSLVSVFADGAGAAILSVAAGAGAVVVVAGALAGAAGAAVCAAAVSDTANAPAISALNSLVMIFLSLVG